MTLKLLTAFVAASLGSLAANTQAAPSYRIIVTKVGFPSASSGGQEGDNGGASAGGGAGSGGNQPAPARCTLPWGGTLASGQSTKAYSQSATTYPTTCEALTVNETCANGNLSAPSASQSCVMTPTVALASATLPGVKDRTPYSYDFGPLLQLGDTSVSGPITWSVASGSLPAGLSLSSAGVLSGTPTSPSTVAFTLQATYKGVNGQQTYHLVVGAADCTLPWGVSLASGQAAQAYSQSAVTYPTTCESVAVTESCSDGTLSAPTASQACAMAPTVSLAAATLPSIADTGTYTHDFNTSLTIGDTSVSGPVSWSVASGTLPAGLSLNTATGVVSGKPTAPGTANFTLQASYKGIMAQQAYQLTVAASACTLPWGATLASGQSVQAYNQSAVTYPTTCASVAVTDSCTDGTLSAPTASQGCAMSPTVSLAATTLANVTDKTGYSHDFSTSLTIGDTTVNGPVTWSVVSGSLPAGLSLNASTGVVSGTPSAPGTANFTLQASYKGITAQQAYQLTVAASACTLPWGSTLASGQSVQAYSQSAVTYPTTCASVAVTESCTDGTLSVPTASQNCTMSPTVTFTNATLPSTFPQNDYSFDVKSVITIGDLGTPDYSSVSWSIISGALPAGLVLNANGTITGKATTAGSSNFTIQAKYTTAIGQQVYKLVVGSLVVTMAADPNIPSAVIGNPYSYDFNKDLTVSGDAAYTAGNGVTWSTSGTLPPGLSLNSSTGILSGQASAFDASGNTFNVTATYKNNSGTQSYTIYPGDTGFSNVALLYHYDGIDGSTTFTDQKGTLSTRFGAAAISTTRYKFGGASLYIPNSSSYLTVPASPAVNFGTGDFTIEGWVNLVTPGASGANYSFLWGGLNGEFAVYANGSNLEVGLWRNTYLAYCNTAGISANSWHHLAVTRASGKLRLFVDGTIQQLNGTGATYVNNSTNITYSSKIGVGQTVGTPLGGMNGYIDEFRITKGLARYITSFTPPTSSFPNQ